MKKITKFLSFILCLSMLASSFVIFPSAATTETVFIDEDFESTTIGTLTSGWSVNNNTGLTATVESSSVEIPRTVNKALNVSHLFSGTAISAKRDFTRSSTAFLSFDYQMESITAPTDARPNGGSNGVSFYCYNDDYTVNQMVYYRLAVMYVSENVGRLTYMDASNKYHDILDADGNTVQIQKGEWYHFEMSVDGTPTDKTVISYKVSHYGKVLAEGSFDHTKTNDPNRLVFHGMAASEQNDSFYIDNVSLTAGSHKYNNDFESDTVGSAPTGIDKLGAGTVSVVEKALNNNKGLYIARHATSAAVSQLVYQSYTDLATDLALKNSASMSFDYQYEWLTPKGYTANTTIEGLNSATFYSISASGGNAAYYRVGVSRVDDDKAKLIGYTGSGSTFDITYNDEIVYIYRDSLYHFDVAFNTDGTAYPTVTYRVTEEDTVIADGEFTCTKKLGVNKISIQCTGSNHHLDEFYIDNLVLNCGDTVIEEDFESFALETEKPTVSGISFLGNNRSVVVKSRPVKKVEKEYYTTKALYVTDTNTSSGPVRAVKTFDGIAELDMNFDFMLATDETYAGLGFALGRGSENTTDLKILLKFFLNDDGETSTLKYYDGKKWIDTSANSIVPFKWYNIKAEVVSGASTVPVYVDGVKVCDAWARSSVERMDRVIFQSHNAAGAGDKFFVDNVNVTTSTVFADEPVVFEDDFSGSSLPAGYSFTGAGSNVFESGAVTLTGAQRATRNTSYTKSGKFSFSVKTNNPDGLYFGLSADGSDIYRINADSLGRLFYQREKVDVAISTKQLVKANEWVNITIDLPHDRNTSYAYLYVDGQMRGHIIYNALATYVNGFFIGAEEETEVSFKNVSVKLSDGVIKIPERTESDPIVYLPEVVGSQVLYLESDKSPKTSTLALVGDESIAVDKQYTSIGVDLGAKQKINAIRLTTAATEEISVNYRQFLLYTSSDNANWEPFGKVTVNHFLENEKWIMLFEFSGVEARYFKINFTGSTSTGITVDAPTENIRAERRIERQWKMAGQNMVVLGDTAPEKTPLIREFVDEGITLSTGDSVGINYGLISAVEAVELVANGLSGLDTSDFEIYTSNDNCFYTKVDGAVLSRDVRESKDVLRLTFDSIECTYIKLYVKGEGISINLDNIADGFCTYSSVEASSMEVNGLWNSRGGEGDFYTLPDGTIVMTYIGYGAENGDFVDNDILAKMSTDGGKTWSPSWIMFSKQEGSVNIMQTRLFWLENGELGALYHEKNGEENRSNLYFRRSYDMGRNWEDPYQITEIYDPYYSLMSSGNCVNRLPNGRILFATTTCEYINDVWGTPHVKVYIWYSDDEGYTWERSDGAIVLPNTACEPCIAPLSNGDLLITMRTRKEGKIYQSISTDGGNTWAQPEAVEGLITPSSTNTIVTIPATGDVLLIWNDEFATDNGERKPLTFAVSSDHGLTYKNKKNTIEAGASWPVMTFYGRRAYMQPSCGVKVCDVEELYYTREGTKTLDDLPKAATPTATYADGRLTGVSNTMQYSLDGGATWKFCGGTSVEIGEADEIIVKDIGTHEYSPSNVQIIGRGEQSLATNVAAILNNEKLVLDSSHSMYNDNMVLEFEVSELGDGEITMSHGDTTAASKVTSSSDIRITADKIMSVTYTGRAEVTMLEASHGLDVSGKVKVTLASTYDKAVVTIETENGKYTSQEFTWLGRNGEIFAKSEGVTLNNVLFSWDCPDYAKDIWFMGDSLFESSGLLIPKAWTYYAIEAGNTNACWFGFGGRKTEQALADFKNALKYDTPEYAVWCMGANNQDSATAVNSAWKKATDEFLAICEEKGITPILATIPNSQNRINYYKNQVVKNSGYRYIDFSAAVGANDTSETSDWTEGYLYTDGLHPTDLGAQAFYNQVIKDFPELKKN